MSNSHRQPAAREVQATTGPQRTPICPPGKPDPAPVPRLSRACPAPVPRPIPRVRKILCRVGRLRPAIVLDMTAEDITSCLLRERLALVGFISSVTRDFHIAEDIFQDVCVKAVGRAGEYESPQHLMNWARLMGRRRGIDVLRARDGKVVGLSEEMLAALEPVWPEGDDAGSPALEALRKCLERLTPNNQEIVRLRYFEGRAGAAVAEAMGRKLDTIYQALARIHKTLGECVKQRLATTES